jgi:hypothetical protein
MVRRELQGSDVGWDVGGNLFCFCDRSFRSVVVF